MKARPLLLLVILVLHLSLHVHSLSLLNDINFAPSIPAIYKTTPQSTRLLTSGSPNAGATFLTGAATTIISSVEVRGRCSVDSNITLRGSIYPTNLTRGFPSALVGSGTEIATYTGMCKAALPSLFNTFTLSSTNALNLAPKTYYALSLLCTAGCGGAVDMFLFWLNTTGIPGSANPFGWVGTSDVGWVPFGDVRFGMTNKSIVFLNILGSALATPSPTPSSTFSPTRTHSPTPTPSATPSSTPSPTSSLSKGSSPSSTRSGTVSPTRTPSTPSPTPSPTVTPSPTATPSPSLSILPTPTSSPTPSPSPSSTNDSGVNGTTATGTTTTSPSLSPTSTTTPTSTPSPSPSSTFPSDNNSTASLSFPSTSSSPSPTPIATNSSGGGVGVGGGGGSNTAPYTPFPTAGVWGLGVAGALLLLIAGACAVSRGRRMQQRAKRVKGVLSGGSKVKEGGRGGGGGGGGGEVVGGGGLESQQDPSHLVQVSTQNPLVMEGGEGGEGDGQGDAKGGGGGVYTKNGPDESGDVWYTNGSGESVWALPEGAILKE